MVIQFIKDHVLLVHLDQLPVLLQFKEIVKLDMLKMLQLHCV